MKKSKELEFFSGDFQSESPLHFTDSGIFTGFPSPAQDYMDKTLDYNCEIIRHTAATFYAKSRKGLSTFGRTMADMPHIYA